MAWSSTLLGILAQRSIGLVYVFRRCDALDRTGRGDWVFSTEDLTLPNGSRLSSASGGAGAVPAIMRAGGLADAPASVQISAPAPYPARGSWSVSLALDGPGAYAFVTRISRGQPAELLVGWVGIDFVDYERIALGVVRQVRMSGDGGVVVELDDAPAYIQSRGWPTVATEAGIFGSLAAALTAITTGSPYSSGDAVMHVDDTSNAEAGPLGYLLRVEPTSHDPYYILATGKTASTFTGCTTAFGTAHTATGGDPVAVCAYDADHPSLIARRILQAGASGATHAGYPASWGLAIPDEFIDETDSDLHQSATLPTPTGSDATLIVEAGWSNGESSLADFLSFFGLFVTTRQGALTVRSVRDPETVVTPEFELAAGIESWAWEAWSADQPQEYEVYQLRAEHQDGSSTTDGYSDASVGLRTLPAVYRLTSPSGTRLWDYADSAAWLTEIKARLGPWYVRIPEVLRLAMAGLGWAQLAPGDIGTVTLRAPIGLTQASAGDLGYVERQVMVASARVDWLGGRVYLDLLALPPESEG